MIHLDHVNDPRPLPPPVVAPIDNSDLTAGDIAYEIFGLIPVTGTFIGTHHTYKACTSDDPISGWEIAKIITQIFSFLLVPQVILGLAHCVKALLDCTENQSLDLNDLPPPPLENNAFQAVDAEGAPFEWVPVDVNSLPPPVNYAAI